MATPPTDLPPTEREKWDRETRLREREIAVKEAELALKTREAIGASWRNPLVAAIIAAAVAATGNAVVSALNGNSQRQLERDKAEEARILEMIKTGDAESAAENLRFLLDAGLISDVVRTNKLEAYLDRREPGTGPVLPGNTDIDRSRDRDDGVPLALGSEALKKAGLSVGRLDVNGALCTAFVVGPGLIATMHYCVREIRPVEPLRFVLGESSHAVKLPVLKTSGGSELLQWALLRLDGAAAATLPRLDLSETPPAVGNPLRTVYFSGIKGQSKGIDNQPQCRIAQVLETSFKHSCDMAGGSGGAPVLSADGKVIGIYALGGAGGDKGGESARIESLRAALVELSAEK